MSLPAWKFQIAMLLRDHFLATTDSFHGSSGGGVYDDQGLLRGILSRGGADYETTTEGCRVAIRVPDEEPSSAEKITYVARALGSEPAAGGCSVGRTGGGSMAPWWILACPISGLCARARRRW